jgi:hypothetical protein
MSYALLYFLVGVFLFVVLGAAHLLGREERRRRKLVSALFKADVEARSFRRVVLEFVVAPALLIALVVGAWHAVLVWAGWLTYKQRTGPMAQLEKPFRVKRENLTKRMSLQEIETVEAVHDPLQAAPRIPFGFLNASWREFLTAREPNSELWEFRAAGERSLAGYAEVKGYASVKWGRIQRHFVSQLLKEPKD